MAHHIDFKNEILRNIELISKEGGHYEFSGQWRFNTDRDDEWYMAKINVMGYGVREKSSSLFYIDSIAEVSLDYYAPHRSGRYYGDSCEVKGIIYLNNKEESTLGISGTCDWQAIPDG